MAVIASSGLLIFIAMVLALAPQLQCPARR